MTILSTPFPFDLSDIPNAGACARAAYDKFMIRFGKATSASIDDCDRTFEMLRTRQHDDGYELAKILEQHNLLRDIDFNCIEELENWRYCIERQTNKARRNWLQFEGFRSPFSLGDAVLINGHWGTVSDIEDYRNKSGHIGYRPNDTDMKENHFHIAAWEEITDWRSINDHT